MFPYFYVFYLLSSYRTVKLSNWINTLTFEASVMSSSSSDTVYSNTRVPPSQRRRHNGYFPPSVKSNQTCEPPSCQRDIQITRRLSLVRFSRTVLCLISSNVPDFSAAVTCFVHRYIDAFIKSSGQGFGAAQLPLCPRIWLIYCFYLTGTELISTAVFHL